MSQSKNEQPETINHKITVEASTVDGILAALDVEVLEQPPDEEPAEYPDALVAVLDTIADIYGGVHEATEQDSRGRSRKMVRQYANREDLSSDDVGHILRVLESHELVVQDGNRWRIEPDDEG